MDTSLEQASRDYLRVEAALRYLHNHRLEQPSLARLADQVGLSPHHFQRLFRRWAGVSPKRFLQFLGREHAKTLLADESVLEAALGSGHSGPGRLHDLFVRTEAITPGEYRSGGAGVSIGHGVQPSPFGPCFVATTERGLCTLEFVDDAAGARRALARLEAEFPAARLRPTRARARDAVEHIFLRHTGDDRQPPAVLLGGTDFQLRVWQALLEIPSGCVRSYGELARRAGRPGAARAAGSALAANSVAYLIPCHRVIRAIGDSGEYRWGRRRKQIMLAWERARAEARKRTAGTRADDQAEALALGPS